MSKVEWNFNETDEQPKMMEVYHEKAWYDVFCYGLMVQEPEKSYQDATLLLAIVAGNDSAIQSLKASIDLGSKGLYFGQGEKGLTAYEFKREFSLTSERGKYNNFGISLQSNRKAVIIAHDKLMGNDEYVMCFDEDVSEEVRKVLGGGKYGLHILPEWKEVVYDELLKRNYIEPVEFYYDPSLFNESFTILRLNLSEEEADELISTLIKQKKIAFPHVGSGTSLEGVDDLTTYMQTYVNALVEKVSMQVKPTHDPMEHSTMSVFNDYKRKLFPVQSHVSTGIAKRLFNQKSVIIQGEMSTGKTTIMTAIADGYNKLKGKTGFFSCVLVPPSLTKKWAEEEIHAILPDAEVHLIRHTKQLIDYHVAWTNQGRPKPTKPTFFVISFTTMRGDCAYEPAVHFQKIKTKKQVLGQRQPYRYGYYCPTCGSAHQVVSSETTRLNEQGEEVTDRDTRTMDAGEFGTTRRIRNSKKPANAFCSECGDNLWTKRVPTRFSSFKEWSQYEKKLSYAINDGKGRVEDVQSTQQLQNVKAQGEKLKDAVRATLPDFKKMVGKPRKVAAIEYMRRRMKNFFDLTIVDEVHELKGGMTAQGNSLGSLVAISKKVIAGTGTLFGGRAEDVYYLLWRMFPTEMVRAGFKFSDVRSWNEQYGNIEVTTISYEDKGEYSNKLSRGGVKRTEKILPGISPFVFSKFLMQNALLVRLVDVWPDPVELVNVPTILVEMDEELKESYQAMEHDFLRAIESREDGHKLYLPLTNNGVAFPDNPFTYPEVTVKNEDGTRDLIWTPKRLDEDRLLNKERKLQEILKDEIAEGRSSIVYVRDTGSSVEGRDIQPRLQHVIEQIPGAKVAILRSNTTKTDERSDWLKRKVEQEGYNVIIVSQELVKVGLDLLCTPTLIYYQFSWSLFTLNQSSRRAWRIGQTEECRIYYLAYKDTYQDAMAQLIAQKNKAAAAINGELSSDGLSAMLGDEGDLQAMLIKSIKSGEKLKGSTEAWVAETSDRARELLSGIGKKKAPRIPSVSEQFESWLNTQIESVPTRNVLLRHCEKIAGFIQKGAVPGFTVKGKSLEIDLVDVFGMDHVADAYILNHLMSAVRGKKEETSTLETKVVEVKVNTTKKRKAKDPIAGQLAFSLFD
ncbi:helicase-related protein [Priestia koreensis]|uniref:helicase-related protein n=1 Tax=Priestia koreensis TaxID=284581 RepID=UPI003D019324